MTSLTANNSSADIKFYAGVPLGLSGSIPILIQKSIKGYDEQAAFSIVMYPFRLAGKMAKILCIFSKYHFPISN